MLSISPEYPKRYQKGNYTALNAQIQTTQVMSLQLEQLTAKSVFQGPQRKPPKGFIIIAKHPDIWKKIVLVSKGKNKFVNPSQDLQPEFSQQWGCSEDQKGISPCF